MSFQTNGYCTIWHLLSEEMKSFPLSFWLRKADKERPGLVGTSKSCASLVAKSCKNGSAAHTPHCTSDVSQMITFVIDSAYVNALAYVVFDIALVSVVSYVLTNIQSTHIAFRLSKGQHVALRESPIKALTGNLLGDGSLTWVVLSIVQVMVLCALFAATLGISGQSENVPSRIERRYLSHLPVQDRTITNKRQSPPIFSSCVSSTNASLLYYPSAFDSVKNVSISDDFQFLDKDGNSVVVNASSVVCQNFGEFPPVLTVKRCALDFRECGNFNISQEVEILLKANPSPRPRTRLIGSFQRNRALWSLLHNPAGSLSTVEYNYLICSLRDPLLTSENQTTFLCTAGKFDVDEFTYTFRIGQLNFSQDSWPIIANRSQNTTATFKPCSNEVEMEHDVLKNGGMLFLQTLYMLDKEKRCISARTFLDSMVDRLSVSQEAKGRKLWVSETRNVTSMEIYSIVIYSSLVGLALVFWTSTAFVYKRCGPSPFAGRVCAEVNSYGGLAKVLQGDECVQGKNAVVLGIVRQEEFDTYHLEPVSNEQPLSALPRHVMLHCGKKAAKPRTDVSRNV